jgi:hypothetical protein
MDALKYPNIFIIQHIIFAFLANALVCILNNLAIKIWAGLFLLGNLVIFKAPTEEATNIKWNQNFLHQEL